MGGVSMKRTITGSSMGTLAVLVAQLVREGATFEATSDDCGGWTVTLTGGY